MKPTIIGDPKAPLNFEVVNEEGGLIFGIRGRTPEELADAFRNFVRAAVDDGLTLRKENDEFPD